MRDISDSHKTSLQHATACSSSKTASASDLQHPSHLHHTHNTSITSTAPPLESLSDLVSLWRLRYAPRSTSRPPYPAAVTSEAALVHLDAAYSLISWEPNVGNGKW